jgi:hypothetical protein
VFKTEREADVKERSLAEALPLIEPFGVFPLVETAERTSKEGTEGK